MLSVGSLFSGIGGFELGLERTGGFKTAWQCEIDPFCLKVLEKHWPDAKRFADIKKMGIEEEIPYVDVICGGFPCQPVSCAGKRKGKEDERWLWPEFYRVVCEVRPRWVVIENVPGLLSINSGRLFAGILRDLSKGGYDAEWNIVSAASVGAPHLRKRVFVVAHTESKQNRRVFKQRVFGYVGAKGVEDVADPNQERRHGWAGVLRQGRRAESQDSGHVPDTNSEGLQGCRILRKCPRKSSAWASLEKEGIFDIAARLCGMDARLPRRVDRLRALGNAIVPQCSEYVGRCILDSLGVA